MTPEIKAIMQDVLQAVLDGQIRNITDVFEIIDKHLPGNSIPWHTMEALTDYMQEVIQCDNIPAAKAFAEKYGLTIQC